MSHLQAQPHPLLRDDDPGRGGAPDRRDDDYIRVRDVLTVRRAHKPPGLVPEAAPDEPVPDLCRLVPAGGVDRYHLQGGAAAVSYRDILSAFQAERHRRREAGGSLHHAPFPDWVVFAPVKLLIKESRPPLRAAVSSEPLYPERAKVAVCAAGTPRVWLFVALAVINSLYGQAFYLRSLRADHRTPPADGVDRHALGDLPLAHRTTAREYILAAADLAYQVSLLRSAEQALGCRFAEQIREACRKLGWKVAFDLLMLTDQEAQQLRSELPLRQWKLPDDTGEERLLPDPLFSRDIFGITLATGGDDAARRAWWEQRVNLALSDEVGEAWLMAADEPGPEGQTARSAPQGGPPGTPSVPGAAVAIRRDPRRCGGHPTVGLTRITVHDVISRLRQYGWDRAAMLAGEQPHLAPAQVDAALEYYRLHKDEIDTILGERTEQYAALAARVG